VGSHWQRQHSMSQHSSSSAARTNLTSTTVNINLYEVLGNGQFRIAYAGTYVGGDRNGQEAVAKKFKPEYRGLEADFFRTDFLAADKAIDVAEDWNRICPSGKEILITRGTVANLDGARCLVEPLIRYFTKFTSNNGWIADVNDEGWAVLAMEAFSHYSYHRSGGHLVVCDLQGRYRHDRYNSNRCRFELTDVAVCSRSRRYGPTDLGEKGIDSFFASHVCNTFCNHDGHWSRPRSPRQWFAKSTSTSMMRTSTADCLLATNNRARFASTLQPVYDYDSSDSDDDSW